MNESMSERFLALSDQQKIVFLAGLSHDLSIHGRAFGMDLNGAPQTQAFMGLNELQHQISQHIAHLAAGSKRYPDEVLLEILQERISAHLKQSLDGLGSGLDRLIREPG